MPYIDGFVLPIRADGVGEYTDIASRAGAIWMEYGALQYLECVLEDDADHDFCRNMRDVAQPQEGETVVMAFILYRDRAHRDEVNKAVMADDRMKPESWGDNMPFDCSRMAWNGFDSLVSLGGPDDR